MLALLLRLSDPARTRPDDFISSWAAGHLVASGANPYDPDAVLAVQRTANWTKEIPYRVGRVLWYALNLGACLLSADLLCRFYRGPQWLRAMSWPLIFTFWPAVIAVRTGQISALVLLGVAGFLYLTDQRRWIAAGACLPLVAIKPQLLHLFWIAILAWVVRERRWRVLAGAIACTLAAVAVTMLMNPAIVPQFLHMAAYDAPQAPASTLGTALRLAIARLTGREDFWLQFVPPALSLFWFVPYWRRHRESWQWRERASAVLIVSLAATAYGWIYDQIVLLVPVIEVATTRAGADRQARLSIAIGFLVINAVILAMNVADADPFCYIWVPFAFGGWWAVAMKRVQNTSDEAA